MHVSVLLRSAAILCPLSLPSNSGRFMATSSILAIAIGESIVIGQVYRAHSLYWFYARATMFACEPREYDRQTVSIRSHRERGGGQPSLIDRVATLFVYAPLLARAGLKNRHDHVSPHPRTAATQDFNSSIPIKLMIRFLGIPAFKADANPSSIRGSW